MRLPAHLTASGCAILAGLPASHVRATFPDRASFVDRTGRGPQSLSSLRRTLTQTRSRGYALEHDEVTLGFASVAVAALDHNHHPLAAVAVTYPADADVSVAAIAREVRRAARTISARVGGQA